MQLKMKQANKLKKILLFVLCLSLAINTLSAYSSWNTFTNEEDDYMVYNHEKYQLIYPTNQQKSAQLVIKNLDNFLKVWDKKFDWSFDEPLKFIINSNKQQVPNAYATFTPFNKVNFWGGGAYLINDLNTISWIKTLIIHEITHSYQMNIKKNIVSQSLHSVFKNSFWPLPPFPLFSVPNMFLPSMFFEGHAVFTESANSIIGRLHNGKHKALNYGYYLR